MEDTIIVLCTCPDKCVGENIARLLVEKRLAACVNLIPDVTSVYRWKDEVVTDQEVQLLIKTSTPMFTDIQQLIRQQHPYELPEIIAVRLDEGFPQYLEWIAREVQKP